MQMATWSPTSIGNPITGSYRVRIDGEWVMVPDGAVVTQPDKTGRAVVWKYYIDSHPRARCFMRGP